METNACDATDVVSGDAMSDDERSEKGDGNQTDGDNNDSHISPRTPVRDGAPRGTPICAPASSLSAAWRAGSDCGGNGVDARGGGRAGVGV